MIIYLHGFDSTNPGNHEKILQLQFIDDDVRFISYSTLHPKHDMQHLLNEVTKVLKSSDDPNPLICGVGLGGYWSERIGFLCGIKQVIFNPNLFPQDNMQNLIDRPEEYNDIETKCVGNFRQKNKTQCLVILSQQDELLDIQRVETELVPYYPIIWDKIQMHKFKSISQHLKNIQSFKQSIK